LDFELKLKRTCFAVGCSSSSQKDGKYSYDPSTDVPGKRSKPQPLTSKELLARIEGSPCPKTLETSLFKLKYSWLSQRGYYPDGKQCINISPTVMAITL
jgi:hypothetical protein